MVEGFNYLKIQGKLRRFERRRFVGKLVTWIDVEVLLYFSGIVESLNPCLHFSGEKYDTS
jgi:hypothetical protein